MKHLKTSHILTLAASAALLFGAVVPAQAAADDSTPIGSGGGVYIGGDDLAPFLPAGNRTFSFSLELESDGSVTGHCNVTQTQGNKVRFDVNSYDIGADGTLYFAGTVTKFTSPDPAVPDLVGWTAVCAVRDNADGANESVFFNIRPPVLNSPLGPQPFTTLTEIYDFYELVQDFGFCPLCPYGPAFLFASNFISPLIPLSAGNVSVDPNAPDPIPNSI